MTRSRAALLIAFLLGGPVMAQAADAPVEAAPIVEAERAFARASIELGMREAFLEFLDDAGVVFRPEPVNGKLFYGSRPARPGALVWQPAHAEVADCDSMGYTTGPWEFREGGPEGKAIAWGYYISVWHATPDAGWKVLADIGIGLDAPAESVAVRDVAVRGSSAGFIRCPDPATAVLDEEQVLAEAAAQDGFARALLDAATDDVRVVREGSVPWVGREAVTRELGARGESWRWTPTGSGGASSGDFGYTYGTVEPVPADPEAAGPGAFLRIWRLDGERGWSVALDVIIPGPRKKD